MRFVDITGVEGSMHRRALFVAPPEEIDLSLLGHAVATANNPDHDVQFLSEGFASWKRNEGFHLPAARELQVGHLLVAEAVGQSHVNLSEFGDLNAPQIAIDALEYLYISHQEISKAMAALEEVFPSRFDDSPEA